MAPVPPHLYEYASSSLPPLFLHTRAPTAKQENMRSGLAAGLLAASVLAMSTSAAPLVDGSWQTDVFVATPTMSLAWRVLSTISKHPLLEPRLVQTCDDCQPYWTTEAAKHLLLWRGMNFIDVTGDHERGATYIQSMRARRTRLEANNAKFPGTVQHRKQLEKAVFTKISDAGPRENLAKFTSFRTRHYRSATGRESQAWLKSTVAKVAETRADLNATVSEFSHSWGQNTVILHIPGRNASATAEQGLTIVGAHQDSTGFMPFLAAPGADDDGSGTVTLLESLRVLFGSNDWAPTSDVEFHWYSAEEGGLLGSQEVVRSYADENKKVKAMLQQDMTAFLKKGTEERVGLRESLLRAQNVQMLIDSLFFTATDFVDEKLRAFVQMLVQEYLDIPAVDTKLGYAASDHASWNKAGYPSVFAIEAPFEDCNLQRIHTTRDTFDHEEFSFEHLLKFVRLTSAFVVELAGWQD